MAKFNFNGFEMNYTVTGDGPPLVLIHGLGSSGRDWERQLAPFADHFQVITLDVRGHGRSGKPPGPYSISQFANDIAALIDHLALGPVDVVGISMGGMIAFQMAVSHREMLKRMVIVNAGPALVPKTFKDRLQIWQRLLIVRLLGMRKMGEVLGERMFPKPEQDELRVMFVQRWAENDPRAYMHAMQALVGWSVEVHLPEMDLPALVISADQDYTPVADKAAYVSQMPNAVLAVIQDSRHATPIDQPEKFNEVVLSFLNQS